MSHGTSSGCVRKLMWPLLWNAQILCSSNFAMTLEWFSENTASEMPVTFLDTSERGRVLSTLKMCWVSVVWKRDSMTLKTIQDHIILLLGASEDAFKLFWFQRDKLSTLLYYMVLINPISQHNADKFVPFCCVRMQPRVYHLVLHCASSRVRSFSKSLYCH